MIMMALLAVLAGARWPNKRDALHIAVAGVMIQAIYLGGVWVSIRRRPVGGRCRARCQLTPVLTVCLAHLDGERSTVTADRRRCCRRFCGRDDCLYAKLAGVSAQSLVG